MLGIRVYPMAYEPQAGEPEKIPNAETIAAVQEALAIAADPKAKGYSNVDELFAVLES